MNQEDRGYFYFNIAIVAIICMLIGAKYVMYTELLNRVASIESKLESK